MSSHPPLSPTRFVLIIVALCIGGVALVTAFSHSRSAEAAEGQPSTVHTSLSVATIPFQADQSTVRQINLHANDLVVDPNTQMIYASVPSIAGANGNSITPLNPVTGVMGSSVFVGSEPGKMAISDNGQFVYVVLDGAATVQRFDVTTQTIDQQFSARSQPFFARDMAVQPGNPGTLAVFRVRLRDSNTGIAIYDDGVQRNTVQDVFENVNLTFKTTDVSRRYALGIFGGSLRRMAVTPSGVTLISSSPVTGSGAIKFDDGRLYTASGHVLDPDSGILLGTFTGTDINSFTPFVSESALGRVYFLSAPFSPGPITTGTVTLRVFNQQTFVPLGTLQIPNVLGTPTRLVRWGSNGLAFCTTGGQTYLIQTTLVPSADPVPTPTPPGTPTPTPTPIPTPAPGELRQISLPTNDLVVNPNTQTIYASVPSSAGANGNSVAPIDPVTGTAGPVVFIGSEPNKLAISDNGAFIYVALDGANAVRRFDVSSGTAGPQFSLGSDPFFGPYRGEDMAVGPGQPDTLVVSRMRPSVSPRHANVAVFDNGVQRGTASPGQMQNNKIEFSGSPLVLYGQNTETTGFEFRKLAVAACGVIPVTETGNVFGGFGIDFKVDNGVAYSSFGRAADPEGPRPLGIFVLLGPNGAFSSSPPVVPDSRAGRIYFLVNDGGFILRVFDIKTFLKLGELRLPGVTGTVSSMVRWGASGLAFRSDGGQVFLLQHSLIGGNDPSFTPAPLPAPPTLTERVVVSSFNGDPGGVTLAITGSLTTTGTTDASGNFTLTGIPPCGSFTITPSKTNYTFNPTSFTVTSTTAIPTVNFTARLKTVGFNLNSLNVSEAAGKVMVFVSRNTADSEPTSVAYETVPGTASDRSDFNTTLGTLQFGPGETSKPITILLTNDTLVEGPEAFTLTLKDPTFADLVPGFSTATITINDNDTQPGAANPLADARFFVRQQYQDFLNRDAAEDVSGFDFWTNQITSCDAEPDPQRKAECLTMRRINVSAAFFISIEFQQTGYLVHRFYTASYPPNAARPRGLPRFSEFLRDTQEVGRGVVVGATGWEQKLEQNKLAFALAWVNRPEFLAEHPQSQTADQFVDSLFQNTGATPTAAERAAAITAFGSGMAEGRALALRSVAESSSVYNRHFNSAFVLAQYFGYLRRNPDDAPDGNFNGFQFWLDKLNQFNGNFVQAEMVKAFLVSQEYQQRFGPANFDISR